MHFNISENLRLTVSVVWTLPKIDILRCSSSNASSNNNKIRFSALIIVNRKALSCLTQPTYADCSGSYMKPRSEFGLQLRKQCQQTVSTEKSKQVYQLNKVDFLKTTTGIGVISRATWGFHQASLFSLSVFWETTRFIRNCMCVLVCVNIQSLQKWSGNQPEVFLFGFLAV